MIKGSVELMNEGGDLKDDVGRVRRCETDVGRLCDI